MHTTVTIPGMHCDSCVAMIKDVSGEFPQITTIDIDLESKKVDLEHTDDFDLRQWAKEVESVDEKYKVHPAT